VDRELTRAELDELLPLYALDALDGEERAQVERYVTRDDAARAEVQSLREAVALLPPADVRAPASLWTTIERSLDEPGELAEPAERAERNLRPTLRVVEPPRAEPRRRQRRTVRVVTALVAAAAVVAIAVLGIQVGRQQSRIDDLAAEMHRNPLQQQAIAARSSKDAHLVRLDAMTGDGTAEVVMLPDGTGYFMDHGLPALTGGATYQLWAKVDDASSSRMVSLGVLGADPRVAPFRLSAAPTMFEITKEPASGSATPGAVVMRGAAV
jgi:anti-sigma-K factor RskA